MLRGNAPDLAEENGYILVGPMGYNPGGWYGSPLLVGRRGRGGVEAPENLSELSETDVMNVLDMIREEFNVDADRLVPVENTRQWADELEELGMTHEYLEIADGDHGNVISIGMPDIFEFFAAHSR